MARSRFAQTTAGRSSEPSEIVFCGCYEAFDRYVAKLVTAIGPGCRWCSEDEFCRYTACPPGCLERWLEEDWVQHLPHRVLSLDDVPGALPFVLYRIADDVQRVRVFSAGPDLSRWMGSAAPLKATVQ